MCSFIKKAVTLVVLCLLFGACGSSPKDVSRQDVLPQIYPDYTEVTIPVGMAPLNFSMADDAFETIEPPSESFFACKTVNCKLSAATFMTVAP